MKFFLFLFLILNYLNSVLLIIPEWDLSSSSIELKIDEPYTVDDRFLIDCRMKMEKKIIRDDSGNLIIKNYVTMGSTTKGVNFDYVESFYNLSGNIVCPRGKYHPYDLNNEKDIDLKFEGGDNWDLSCYLQKEDTHFFFAFYAMNGEHNNAYLVHKDNVRNKDNWYNGVKIVKDKLYELYDYRFNFKKEDEKFNMLALINQTNWLKLGNVIYNLEDGDQRQYSNLGTTKDIVQMKKYTQGYFFKSGSFKFYFMTYNNISDFKSGYSYQDPQNYADVNSMVPKINDNPDFEFLEDVEIENMNFMLNNKFLYYIMKVNNSEKRYYGVFDIELNKIIFNTAEEITKFVPLNLTAMLAITKDKAYEICLYKDNDGNCRDNCTDKYFLSTSGNICGGSCPSGKFKLKPNDICIDSCNETIFYKKNDECGLCKDFDSTKKYKFEEGNQCLANIPEGAIISNAKLNLLVCNKNVGYYYKDNKCDKNCYELCKECIDYSTDENDQKCKSCINDLFNLDDKGNCYCKNGYYKSGKNCEICTNTIKCDTYKKNTCNCNSCLEKNYLINDKCEKCSDKCFNCTTNEDYCTSCEQNKFLDNNQCHECTDKSFCNQIISDTCKCEKCKDGYYNDFFRCFECSTGCKTCNNKNECNDCKDGYFKKNNKCLECSTCKETIDNSCECKSCYDTYFLENGQCIQCSTGSSCKRYQKDTCKCEECQGRYYNDNFVCKKCSYNCKDCNGGIEKEDHHCTSCNESLYLVDVEANHICVENCSDYNYTLNKITNKCENPKNGTENGDSNNNIDYMLWIFVGIIGILLIIISICICKKCCSNKSDTDLINETNELDEKQLYN